MNLSIQARLGGASMLISILIATLGAACSAPTEEESVGDDEGAKRVKPVDDENLGRVVVNLPNGIPAVDSTTRATYRSTALTFGTAGRFTAGAGCVALSSSSLSGNGNQDCGITVVKKQSTTVNLAGVRATYDATASGPLAVDFGPRAVLAVQRSVQNQLQQVSVGSLPGWDGTATSPVVLLPGAYTFDFQIYVLTPTTQTLAPGSVTNLNLTPPDRRATINITAPVRELPDWKHPNYPQCMGSSVYLVQRSVAAAGQGSPRVGGNDGVAASMAVPLTANRSFRVFPFIAAQAPMHYEVVINNVSVPLALQPGQSVTVPVERLDVDDVEITDEAGQTHTVRGTFQVFRQEANNTWTPVYAWDHRNNCFNVESSFGTYQTNTGLDLPQGTYRLVISYVTAEGTKQQEQIVTLP